MNSSSSARTAVFSVLFDLISPKSVARWKARHGMMSIAQNSLCQKPSRNATLRHDQSARNVCGITCVAADG